MPSDASRPVRLAASARPRSRRMRLAASRSPFASVNACLQSIIPAPVASLRAFTSRALISAIGCYFLRFSAARFVLLFWSLFGAICVGGSRFVLLGCLLGLDLQLPLGLGLGCRARKYGGLFLDDGLGSGGRLFFPPAPRLSLDDRVGNDARQEGTGSDGIVVARDPVIDFVRVAVRVEHGDDRNPELPSLPHRNLLFLCVEDVNGVGNLVEVADPRKIAMEFLVLMPQLEGLFFDQAIEGAGLDHLLQLAHTFDPVVD